MRLKQRKILEMIRAIGVCVASTCYTLGGDEHRRGNMIGDWGRFSAILPHGCHIQRANVLCLKGDLPGFLLLP